MIQICDKSAEFLPSIDQIANKPEEICPVQWAVGVAELAMKNACGRGTFCRDGLKQLYLIGKDITLNKGTMEDIELLQELCQTMLPAADCEMSARCIELYQASLDQHYQDWCAHVLRKRCQAGVCAGMKKGGSAAAAAGIHIDIPVGTAEGYAQVALQHTSPLSLEPKPLKRPKKNRPHLVQPPKPIDPDAPEISEQEGPNTVIRRDGRIIRRYRTQTGIIAQD